MAACPLCASSASRFFDDASRGWTYARCGRCALVFRDDGRAPSAAEERRRYEQHENHPGQRGYVDFLEPMASAIAERCAAGSEGLDYGCGPGPVLALMLGERGMKVALHDPYFAPCPRSLERTYDFVTCTEAAEHFRRPAEDFSRLARLLKPGGWLGVMTSALPEDGKFAAWHYRLDPTHLAFYGDRTFEWLASEHSWRLSRPAAQLALFQAVSMRR